MNSFRIKEQHIPVSFSDQSSQSFQNHADMVIALRLAAEMEIAESPNLTDTSNSESSEVSWIMKIEQMIFSGKYEKITLGGLLLSAMQLYVCLG